QAAPTANHRNPPEAPVGATQVATTSPKARAESPSQWRCPGRGSRRSYRQPSQPARSPLQERQKSHPAPTDRPLTPPNKPFTYPNPTSAHTNRDANSKQIVP